jgi:hypothetical protein
MPSISHEGPLDLVRQCPEMAVGLVQGTPGVKLPGEVIAALAPTDMSAVVPVQYLADMVVLISSAVTRKPVLAVVIEPQLRDSEAVLKLLDARHLAPSQEQRQRVTSCADPVQLDLWFDRAITAATATAVFAD